MDQAQLAKLKAGILEQERRNKELRKDVEDARKAGFDVKETERELAKLEANVARAKSVYIEGK